MFDFSSNTSPMSNQQIKVISGRGTNSGPIETPHHGLDAMRIDRRRRGHRRQVSRIMIIINILIKALL